jgi:hypothetical protein
MYPKGRSSENRRRNVGVIEADIDGLQTVLR